MIVMSLVFEYFKQNEQKWWNRRSGDYNTLLHNMHHSFFFDSSNMPVPFKVYIYDSNELVSV